MQIIDRKGFLSLPAGIIYHKYRSLGDFGQLAVKHDTCGNDWYYADLYGDIDCYNSNEYIDKMSQYEKTGEDFRFDRDSNINRDGLYQEDELFAVYDPKDVVALITRLIALVAPNFWQAKELPPA